MNNIFRELLTWPARMVWSLICYLLRTLNRFQLTHGVSAKIIFFNKKSSVGVGNLDDKNNTDSTNEDLLQWVRSLLVTEQSSYPVPVDLGPSWRDGVALCHLINSIFPGAYPDVASLKTYNRVRNCRLALRLANKHLQLPTNAFSAEDIAAYSENQEQKVRVLLVTLKRLAGLPRRPSDSLTSDTRSQITDSQPLEPIETQSSVPKDPHVEVECIQPEEISGLVGKPCNIELCLPTWMDPDELTAEVHWCDVDPIPEQSPSSLSLASANPYIHVTMHRRSMEGAPNATAVVLSFVPCRYGKHEAFVKWRDDDVTGSPFCINIGDARDSSLRSSFEVEKPSFRSAAAKVMSKVMTTNKLRFAKDICTSDCSRKLPFQCTRPTLYGVAAAVLRRTSKVERSLDNGGRHVDHLTNIKIKRRRIIRQTVCSIDGTEKLGIILDEDRSSSPGPSNWPSFNCSGQDNNDVASLAFIAQHLGDRSAEQQRDQATVVTDVGSRRREPEVERGIEREIRASNATEVCVSDVIRRKMSAERGNCPLQSSTSVTPDTETLTTGLPLLPLNMDLVDSTGPNVNRNKDLPTRPTGHHSLASNTFQETAKSSSTRAGNFNESSVSHYSKTEMQLSQGEIRNQNRYFHQHCDWDLVEAAVRVDAKGQTKEAEEVREATTETPVSKQDEIFSTSSRRSSFSRQNAVDKSFNKSLSNASQERQNADHVSLTSAEGNCSRRHHASTDRLPIPTQPIGFVDNQDECGKSHQSTYSQRDKLGGMCSSPDEMTPSKSRPREGRVTSWRDMAVQTSFVDFKPVLADRSTQTQSVFTQETAMRLNKPPFSIPRYVTRNNTFMVDAEAGRFSATFSVTVGVDAEAEQLLVSDMRPSTPFVHLLPSTECPYSDPLRRPRRRRQEVNTTVCGDVMQPSVTISTTYATSKQDVSSTKGIHDNDTRENRCFQIVVFKSATNLFPIRENNYYRLHNSSRERL